MDKDALMEKDLYDLFGVPSTATVQDIKKSYRKKALKCHPDKNPDNPSAVQLFLELSTALEILVEESSRATYDKLLTARQAAKIRHDALDSKRKKLKEDLEAREKFASSKSKQDRIGKSAEEKLKAEIDRLRKESSKQLLEEMEKVRELVREEMNNRESALEEDGAAYRLKVKWKSEKSDEENGGYNYDNLHNIFSKYGDISCLIVSQKKKGSALLEYETKTAAVRAYQLEKGYGTNQLILSWVVEPPDEKIRSNLLEPTRRCTPLNECGTKGGLFPSFSTKGTANSTKSNFQQTSVASDEDFETVVFAKMREAQEKKNTTV